MTSQKALALLVLLLGATATAWGSEPYTLFRPVPRDRMRPLAADRPDATESPYTVDAGHAQLELDIAAYLRDHAAPDGARVRTRAWSFLVTNAKIGVTQRVDLQLVFATFTRQKTSDLDAGTSTTNEGFGDLTLRIKINLWGNDGGRTAGAIMPFVKFPTNQDDLGNDDVEGGVIVPVSIELPAGWGLGFQLQLDAVRDGADTGHDLDLASTVVLGHAIVGDLSGFVELSSRFPGEPGAHWQGTLNTGVTYAVHDDLQLDAGVYIGLSRAADDLVVFVGVTRRF